MPADLRLIRSRDLQVAEAALTGESAPVEKAADAHLGPETPLAERRNMVYASTLVTYGQATGVVTAIGDNTEVGRISRLLAEAHELQTPLTRKIAGFSKIVLYAILALAAATFGIGVLRGQPAGETFNAAIALAVAMIPEGLPAALTVTLAIGVSRMARRRAIIRKLPAVETLGSTTVICSDKTGTLTQNQMTVTEIYAGDAFYQSAAPAMRPAGEISPVGDSMALRETLTAGLLCNDSALAESEGRWTAQGDPTEVALITAALKGGLTLAQQSTPRAWTPSRSSRNTSTWRPSMISALAAACSMSRARSRRSWRAAGCARRRRARRSPLDIDAVHRRPTGWPREGLRVLAFARRQFPLAQDSVA